MRIHENQAQAYLVSHPNNAHVNITYLYSSFTEINQLDAS